MSLFQSNLLKQIRNLPKILNFVKIIHYHSKLFTGVLRGEARHVRQARLAGLSPARVGLRGARAGGRARPRAGGDLEGHEPGGLGKRGEAGAALHPELKGSIGEGPNRTDRTEPFEPFEPFEFFQNGNFP